MALDNRRICECLLHTKLQYYSLLWVVEVQLRKSWGHSCLDHILCHSTPFQLLKEKKKKTKTLKPKTWKKLPLIYSLGKNSEIITAQPYSSSINEYYKATHSNIQMWMLTQADYLQGFSQTSKASFAFRYTFAY